MCDSRARHIIPIMNHCSLPIQFTLLIAPKPAIEII